MIVKETPLGFVPNILMLGIEAQQVVGLRWVQLLAGGGAAQREAQLMVHEKVRAGVDAMLHLAAGRLPNGIVDDYRCIVQANIARLSAGGH